MRRSQGRLVSDVNARSGGVDHVSACRRRRPALPALMRSNTRTAAWHWLVASIAIGLLRAAIGLTLWHDRADAETGAMKDTANLARTFEENIVRTIEAVVQ